MSLDQSENLVNVATNRQVVHCDLPDDAYGASTGHGDQENTKAGQHRPNDVL